MANDADAARVLWPSARPHVVIRATLRASIKKQHVPGSLAPLLEVTYDDGPGAKAALSAWARNSRLQPGGTFQVRLSTLRPRTKKRGLRTYVHCNVPECPFKIQFEEGPDGRFGALDANLSHSDTGHHAPAATAQDKRAAGDCWLPPVGPGRYCSVTLSSTLELKDTLLMTWRAMAACV
jgi:hypothetical protein